MSPLDPRFGDSLASRSTAKPGAVDMSVFAPKRAPVQEGRTSSDYLRRTREDDPWPADDARKRADQVALSRCRFLTKPDELFLDEPFEMAVDVKRLSPKGSLAAEFDLFRTRTTAGKSERARIWAGQAGRAVDAKADPVVVRAKADLNALAEDEIGETVVFELEAHHPQVDGICRSEPCEVVLRRPPDKDVPWVFYAPGRDEYLVIEPDEQDAFLKSLDELADLRQRIVAHRDATTAPGDPKEFAARTQKLRTEIKDEFQLDKNPSDAIQELLLWAGSKRAGKMAQRVYIGKNEIAKRKSQWLKSNDTTVKKLLDEALKRANKDPMLKKEMEAKVKAVLLPGKSIEGQWPLPYATRKKEGKSDTLVGGFSGEAQAQFARFTAGCNAEAGFDLKERKLTVGAMAGATYDLAKGTVSGSWSLPDRDGFDLFRMLVLSGKAREGLVPGAQCRLRYTLKAEGFALAGLSVAAVAELPCLELKENKAAVDVGVSGLAGVSLQGKALACVDWSPSASPESFKNLAGLGGVVAGNAGAGAEVKFEASVHKGRIRMRAGAMATFGLGGKAGLECELDAGQGVEMLSHLFHCVQWRHIQGVERLVFDTMLNAHFAAVVLTFRVGQATVARLSDFKEWLQKETRAKEKAKKLKENIRTQTTFAPVSLRQKSPEALGRVLLTVLATFETEDYAQILRILKASESEHQLKCIVRNAQDVVELGPNAPDATKESALREGLRRLRGHGEREAGDDKKTGRLREKYLNDLGLILSKAGIP